VFAAVSLVASLLVIGGCTPAAQPSEPAAKPAAEVPSLADTSWSCYEFSVAGSPQTAIESVPITAKFGADGTLSGNAGVNTYSTTYKTDGNKITIDPQIVTTKMAGSQEAMDQESNYLLALPTAVSYNVLEKGDLVLLNQAGGMVARYNPAQ
jgi:heat shock protein HslJ